MNIAIVYDSQTGTTAKAAEVMGNMLAQQGHHCQVLSCTEADPSAVSKADLICIGGWVKGLFVILQHPTAKLMQFVDRMGDLTGKRVVVFCTYKLAAGSTLQQMARALEAKGAQVIGQFKYRGSNPDNHFGALAQSLS
jgi:flavodoxin